MAIDFFNRAASFSHWIAFIVPFQFKKYSVHSKLDKRFKLVAQMDLEPNSFLFKGKDYRVNACFQIWTRRRTSYQNKRILKRPPIKHRDFELFQYNRTEQTLTFFDQKKYQWDIAVYRQGFYFSRQPLTISNAKKLDSKIQYIFIKFKREIARKIFDQLDFKKLANRNTVIPGFGKADLVSEYKKVFREKQFQL